MAVTTGRKPGPSLRLALAVMAAGVLLAVPSGVIIAVRAVRTIGTPAVATPATFQRHLGTGAWHVFQRTGWTNGFGGFSVTHNNLPTLAPADVTVTGPDGSQLETSYVSANETITQNSVIYTAVVGFRVRSAGTYTIQVAAPNSEVLVTRSLGDTLRGILVPLAVGAGGGALLTIGLVLLIIGASHRRDVNRLHIGQPGVPPGWYPDVMAPGRLRWWDGGRWTEHRA